MVNLETKWKVDGLEGVKERLGFANHFGLFEQADIYYLVGERRVKIREAGDKAELISYVRKNEHGTRISTFHRHPIPRPLIGIVETAYRLRFGIKAVVVKKRNLYIYKNTRIHLDTVSNLGFFVEIETVCQVAGKEEEYAREHEEVKDKLMLSFFPTIAGSYSDLLLLGS